jgi:hypothetical protein
VLPRTQFILAPAIVPVFGYLILALQALSHREHLRTSPEDDSTFRTGLPYRDSLPWDQNSLRYTGRRVKWDTDLQAWEEGRVDIRPHMNLGRPRDAMIDAAARKFATQSAQSADCETLPKKLAPAPQEKRIYQCAVL